VTDYPRSRARSLLSLIVVACAPHLSGCNHEGVQVARVDSESRSVGEMEEEWHLVLVHGGRYAVITSGDQARQHPDQHIADWSVLDSHEKWLSASSAVSQFEKLLERIVESSPNGDVFLFAPLSEEDKREADALANMALKYKGVSGAGAARVIVKSCGSAAIRRRSRR